MASERILAMVLAGGEGSRLAPLTSERSKPAVPFGSRYRIVDFVLSNFINSEIYSLYILVQYRSQSLIEHIQNAWVLAPIIPSHFITVVPPQMREGPEWFQGTADAVWQNLNLLDSSPADLVAVFGADHVYRMDIRQMAAFHRERRADVTVAALPVARESASAFGVIDCAEDGRIRGFVEKPADPPAMPGDPQRAYASMGNYLFGREVLEAALHESRTTGGKDFGRDLLPRMVATHRVFAYDFGTNRVPGVHDYEEPSYWRDVGTLDAFYEANMDTLGPTPKLDLFNPRWPIESSNYQGPVANVASATIENSHIAAGTFLRGATVRNSVIRREVTLEEGVVIEDSVIMDYCRIGRGARVRRAIIDRHNTVAPGARIGYDAQADRSRYTVSESGVVVLAIAPWHADSRRYWS